MAHLQRLFNTRNVRQDKQLGKWSNSWLICNSLLTRPSTLWLKAEITSRRIYVHYGKCLFFGILLPVYSALLYANLHGSCSLNLRPLHLVYSARLKWLFFVTFFFYYCVWMNVLWNKHLQFWHKYECLCFCLLLAWLIQYIQFQSEYKLNIRLQKPLTCLI